MKKNHFHFGFEVEWKDNLAICTPKSFMAKSYLLSRTDSELKLGMLMEEKHYFLLKSEKKMLTFMKKPVYKAVLLNNAIDYPDANGQFTRTDHIMVYPVFIEEVNWGFYLRVNDARIALFCGDEVMVEMSHTDLKKAEEFVAFFDKA